jgi:hypothetical protein
MALLTHIEHIEVVLRRAHGLLEAPRFATGDAVVYSDVLAGGAFRVLRDERIDEVLPKRRGIGGIVAHEDGGWVLSGRTIVHVGAAGAQREIMAEGSFWVCCPMGRCSRVLCATARSPARPRSRARCSRSRRQGARAC